MSATRMSPKFCDSPKPTSLPFSTRLLPKPITRTVLPTRSLPLPV
jgi:hypothetical protein